MRVLYFFVAAQAAGCRQEDWEVDGELSLDEFWQEAERRHPELAEMREDCRVACGGVYLQPGDTLDPGKEAAVIPPVSGG